MQAFHLVLLLAGTLCSLGYAGHLIATGRWRNPLAGVALPPNGPSIVGVVTVLLTFLLLSSLAGTWVEWAAREELSSSAAGALTLPATTPSGPTTEPSVTPSSVPSPSTAPASAAAASAQPGSAAWHRLNAASGAAQLATAVLMVALLHVTRTPRRTQERPRTGRNLALALGAFAALLPITTAQQKFGEVLWLWWYPQEAPPVHEVLRALHESEWGAWGTVQLLVSAVAVAPLVEELFFRGVVLNALCLHLRRAWASVVVSAVAFGCVHAQPQDVLPLASMGIVLGYLRLRTDSLLLCIVVHALFNARTMVFAILAPELVGGG